MKQTVPSSEIKTRRNLPWLNKSLIQSMWRRNMLFKQAKRTGDFSNYKHARNKTLEKLRSAKRRYMRQLNPNDTKQFWKAMKFLNRKVKSVPTLSDGLVVQMKKQKCSTSFFCDMLQHCFLPNISICCSITIKSWWRLLCFVLRMRFFTFLEQWRKPKNSLYEFAVKTGLPRLTGMLSHAISCRQTYVYFITVLQVASVY